MSSSSEKLRYGSISATPGPSFVYPVDGQKLGFDGWFLFKINPVDGASGYLYGFFQDGVAVWENYHDEHTLSGTEYGIAPDSPGHRAIHPGLVQVWVRALVNGQWTDPTIINITVENTGQKDVTNPGVGNNGKPPGDGGDGQQPPFFCIRGPNSSCQGSADPALPDQHVTWNQYLDYLRDFADGVGKLDSVMSCGQTSPENPAACLELLVERFPALAVVVDGLSCAAGALGPEAISKCLGLGALGLKAIVVAIQTAANYNSALRDFLNTNMI